MSTRQLVSRLFCPWTLAALFFIQTTTGQAPQSQAPSTFIKASRLLDPRTGNILSPAAVLVEGGKIKEVGSPTRIQADSPPQAKVVDLGNAILLPGLIDAHTHLFLDIIVPPEAEIARHFNGEFAPGWLPSVVLHLVRIPEYLPLTRQGIYFATQYPTCTSPCQRFDASTRGRSA